MSAAIRSKRLASATRTLAPESVRPYTISSLVHQPLRPTRTAPMSTVPQNDRHHSGLFWLSTATRSPLSTPASADRAELTELAVRTKSPKVMRRSPKTRNSLSPWARPNWATVRRSGSRFTKTFISIPSTVSVVTSNGPPGPVSWARTSSTVGIVVAMVCPPRLDTSSIAPRRRVLGGHSRATATPNAPHPDPQARTPTDSRRLASPGTRNSISSVHRTGGDAT